MGIGLGEALSKAGSSVPLVDVYSALSAFGSSTNVGLVAWLNMKMLVAESADNIGLVDKYQAYKSCLLGDCSRLAQLATANAAPARQLNLAGTWTCRGAACCKDGGLDTATQTDPNNLTFTNECTPRSTVRGHFVTEDAFVVEGWPVSPTISPDGRTIDWHNGSTWVR